MEQMIGKNKLGAPRGSLPPLYHRDPHKGGLYNVLIGKPNS